MLRSVNLLGCLVVGPRRANGCRPAPLVTMADDAPLTYGYTEEDVGWGCVFRSVQNAAGHTGRPVPSLEALLAASGRARGSWSEPADFVGAVPGSRALLAGASEKWLKLTRAEQCVVCICMYCLPHSGFGAVRL